MKLLSIQLARSLWFVDLAELNPRGKNVFVDFIPMLIEEFEFKQFPKEGEDFKDGMKFTSGTFTNSLGDDLQVGLTIFSDGFAADAYTSTKACDEFLEQAISLLSQMGYFFERSMVQRKSYLSQVVVRCTGKLASLNPKLEAFAKQITESVGGAAFDFAGLEFWPDQTQVYKPANFSFQRKTGDPSSSDRFWSQAPLPTDRHLELLGELE